MFTYKKSQLIASGLFFCNRENSIAFPFLKTATKSSAANTKSLLYIFVNADGGHLSQSPAIPPFLSSLRYSKGSWELSEGDIEKASHPPPLLSMEVR